MSCNGCRILRKGCREDCVLRHCLQWIDSPQAQAHATVFVSKFFGRAGLMSFISSVPITQRSHLFQSLLYEAVGRSINPVNGVVGLLWTGNWHLCQLGVERVLRGGALCPLPHEFFSGGAASVQVTDDESFGSVVDNSNQQDMRKGHSRMLKRKVSHEEGNFQAHHQSLPEKAVVCGGRRNHEKKHRAATPSDESETTTSGSSPQGSAERKLLRLFF